MARKLLILNGPGTGDVQSSENSLSAIKQACEIACQRHGFDMTFLQSDDDEDIVKRIAECPDDIDGLIFNPVADLVGNAASRIARYQKIIQACAIKNMPVIEVRLDNIFGKDALCSTTVQMPGVQIGFICGAGVAGFELAIEAMALKDAA